MRSRRGQEAPVSFFSFQDIITAISGIMIFLVLMMALELTLLDHAASPLPKSAPREPRHELFASRVRKSVEKGSLPVRDMREAAAAFTRLLREQQSITNQTAELATAIARDQRSIARLAEQQKALLSNMEAIRRERAALRKATELTLIPERDSDKQPIVVECSGDRIRAARIDHRDMVRAFDTDDKGKSAFIRYAAARSDAQEYFLFMIKPSGVDYAMSLIQLMRNKGFDAGYDALEEQLAIRFWEAPEKNAP